jgi:hypothetical protein
MAARADRIQKRFMRRGLIFRVVCSTPPARGSDRPRPWRTLSSVRLKAPLATLGAFARRCGPRCATFDNAPANGDGALALSEGTATRHARLEERSLALHREIAGRLRQNPGLLAGVRERLGNDINSGCFSLSVADAMREWLDLLNANPLEQTLALLTDPGENARRLRQSTPFAGILTQEERHRILEEHER